MSWAKRGSRILIGGDAANTNKLGVRVPYTQIHTNNAPRNNSSSSTIFLSLSLSLFVKAIFENATRLVAIIMSGRYRKSLDEEAEPSVLHSGLASIRPCCSSSVDVTESESDA